MLLPLLASFQLAAAQPNVYHGRDGQLRVAAPRHEAAVTVDGRLDEPVWSRAALLTGFSLYQPADGRPAPDSTEVRVWYSPSAIHFGIRAYEPHGTVTYSVAERDRLASDDQVEIHLDTFDERNRALVFVVNPLGIQADGTKSEGGGFIPGANVMPGMNDLSADFIWESKGNVTEWGYEVEVRIPFSSMRYPVAPVQQWGLQIDRRVMHSGYEQTWTPAKRASASFIGQSGWLTDLSGMSHGQVFELNPEATNTVTGAACCAPAQRDWNYDAKPRLGGNVRWTVGSNFVLNGTMKPDFSQVEADATQIAADQRFALFYAEKRPFFVEGLDQFNVPNTLVYTRTIVQPAGAVKLTGKLGRADVAVMSALDDAATTSSGDRPLVNVVRLRRGVGEQSLVGLVYSDRVSDGRSNRVLGADSRFVFGKYYAQFQGVGSLSRNRVVRPGGGGPGYDRTAGPLWEAVLDRTGRSWGFHYNIIGVAPAFRADNGYLPRTGYVQPNISNRITWYGRQGGTLEQFNAFVTLNGIWQYDEFFSANHLLEDYASMSMSLRLRGGWSVGMTPKLACYAFDRARYEHLPELVPSPRITAMTSTFSLSTPQFQKFSGSLGANVGNDVDFQETARAQRLDYNATLNFRPSSRLRLAATYQSSEFTRRSNDEQIAFTRIPRLKVEYQVARPIFVRVVSQYTATKREPLRDPRTGRILLVVSPAGVAPSARSASNSLRTDWLFSYRPTPGTVAFVGYGGSLSEADPLAFQTLRRTSDAFFVKLSYAFRARL